MGYFFIRFALRLLVVFGGFPSSSKSLKILERRGDGKREKKERKASPGKALRAKQGAIDNFLGWQGPEQGLAGRAA